MPWTISDEELVSDRAGCGGHLGRLRAGTSATKATIKRTNAQLQQRQLIRNADELGARPMLASRDASPPGKAALGGAKCRHLFL